MDRLVPEKAVELLEVLKLFLDCEHCVFVLAIDYNVVIRGIKSKYGDDLDDEKGKAFFEKIIQVPFTVPVANYNMQQFIANSLNKLGIQVNDRQKVIVSELVRNSIGNNPRSINRLFNSVSLLMYINNSKNQAVNENQLLLLAMVCFQLRFEEAYNYILYSYNRSPFDAEETELFLIDLLENAFDLLEDGAYNALLSQYGSYSFSKQQDTDDFSKFYRNLKNLLGVGEEQLTVEQFEKLLDKMTLSNAVSIGNTDTVVKKVQNHEPNEDVQFVIRKLFNRLVNQDHFELKEPQHFGKEKKEERLLPLASEFMKIAGHYDTIRLTQGKGQGINIFSAQNKSNFIYFSGDTYGQLNNDGIGIYINNKLVDKVKKNNANSYLASDLRHNEEKYKEFENSFIDHLSKLLDSAREIL